MKVSLTKAATLVNKSRATIYNNKKAGILSVEKDAKGQTVVDISELQRVYGDVKLDSSQSNSFQIERSNQSKNQEFDAAEIALLKNEIAHKNQILDKLSDEVSYFKEQVSLEKEEKKSLTILIEDQRRHAETDSGWKDAFRQLEAKVANQIERERQISRQYQIMKRDLEKERSKSIWQKLFG